MFSKVAFFACLCVAASFGAKLQHQPAAPAAARALPNGNAIPLPHKPYEARYNDSSLVVTCLDGGLLTLELTTENFARKSNIVIGASGDDACQSDDLIFPAPDGQDGTVTVTAANDCGRQLVNATETTPSQFKWKVVVNENVLTTATGSITRPFRFTAEVTCEQKPGESEVEAPQELEPIDQGPVEFDQEIQFNITNDEGTVDGKWQFSLKPAVTDSLGGQNFKINSCIAKPIAPVGEDPVPDAIQAAIITAGCINDEDFFDVTVNVDQSPAEQLLTLYPFALSGYEDLVLQLTCTVNLCPGADCAVVRECSAEVPAATTPVPEETTQAPEETTQAPEETTQAPEETTQAPEETTPVQALPPRARAAAAVLHRAPAARKSLQRKKFSIATTV